MSTIWGSLHLFSAKNSRSVDDGSITFGQVLPVALLIASLLSIVARMVHLHGDTSSTSPGSGQGPDCVITAYVSSELAQPDPSLQSCSQPQWLTQTYYGEPWMMPVITIALGQVLYLTVTIFQLLASNFSAAKTLYKMLVWIFVTQPASCFLVILLGLAVGMPAPNHRSRRCCSLTCLPFVYWVVAALVFVYSMLFAIIGRYLNQEGGGDPISSNVFFSFVNVGGTIVVMLLYCVICCLIIRSPANGDEEQIEMITD